MAKKQRRPGKFECCADQDIGEKLYEMTMESGQDDELGDVSDFGWYALLTKTGIRGASNVIVHENNDGFFDYNTYRSAAAAKRAYALLEEEYHQWLDDTEDEEIEE